jgi:hypothetical protein
MPGDHDKILVSMLAKTNLICANWLKPVFAVKGNCTSIVLRYAEPYCIGANLTDMSKGC